MPVEYHIKCTRQSTGETWLAYGGGIHKWPREQAEAEAEACRRQWPDVTFELQPTEPVSPDICPRCGEFSTNCGCDPVCPKTGKVW